MEVTADNIAQGAGDKEVLLHETQFLAVLRLVIRIEHLRDGLVNRLVAYGLDVAAAIEGREVELLCRL